MDIRPPNAMIVFFAVGSYFAGYFDLPLYTALMLGIAMTVLQFFHHFRTMMVAIPIGHYFIPFCINVLFCSVVGGIGFGIQLYT